MSIFYLIDTNIVSYYLQRRTPVLEARLNQSLAAKTIAISVMTRAELRFGQLGMQADDRRRGLIDGFFERLPTLPWTRQAADIYGTLKAQHKRLGTPIGEIDTQIAAHALAEKLILVTHNTKHFEKVPGLQLEDWLA